MTAQCCTLCLSVKCYYYYYYIVLLFVFRVHTHFDFQELNKFPRQKHFGKSRRIQDSGFIPELLLLWQPSYSVTVRSLAAWKIAPRVRERMPAYILGVFLLKNMLIILSTDFSRPGNINFKIPGLFQVFHDRTNPVYFYMNKTHFLERCGELYAYQNCQSKRYLSNKLAKGKRCVYSPTFI